MIKSKKEKPHMSFAKQLKRRSGSRTLTACQTKVNDCHLPQGPIYKVLQENLLEQGCPTAAKYFEKLVAKENDLIQIDFRLKKRVRDAHCLLLAVVENVKSAELAFRIMGDKEQTLRILVQTVHMIQSHDDAFHWLVKEFYRIILRISEHWNEEYAEILSRTRFEYGVVLAEKGDTLLNEAILQMSKSLEACKGVMWYTNDRDRNILHEDVCVMLCETLLRQAKIDSKIDPKKAAELANRAVLIIMEVGISANKDLFCISKLRQSEYLVAGRDYEGALRVLNNLKNHIMANDSTRNKCEFYLWLGICLFRLSRHGLALRKFQLSLRLSENYNFADLKAQVLLYLGRIYAQNETTQTQARQCFVEAKNLFQRLRDFENEKLAKFLMAKLRAHQIFPNYFELIKKASWINFGHLFDLIQWKQRLLPFWNENGELRSHEDQVQCLLDEEVEKEQLATIED